jgi:hypothetical protein
MKMPSKKARAVALVRDIMLNGTVADLDEVCENYAMTTPGKFADDFGIGRSDMMPDSPEELDAWAGDGKISMQVMHLGQRVVVPARTFMAHYGVHRYSWPRELLTTLTF